MGAICEFASMEQEEKKAKMEVGVRAGLEWNLKNKVMVVNLNWILDEM